MFRRIFLAIAVLSLSSMNSAETAANTPEGGLAAKPETKFVKLSSGLKLQYAEQGDATGTPVILLHGYTDSWRSFELVLPQLPKNLRAFALTQRGHGDSERPATGYSPKDFSEDVLAFTMR